MNTTDSTAQDVTRICAAATNRRAYRSTTLSAAERQERDADLLAELDRLRDRVEGTAAWSRLTSARESLTRRMAERGLRMTRRAV